MESKKKACVAILVSDKIDFQPTKIKRDKESHYIIVKGTMQKEELTILFSPLSICLVNLPPSLYFEFMRVFAHEMGLLNTAH